MLTSHMAVNASESSKYAFLWIWFSSIIEQGASQEKRLGFELLVEEWGTSGRYRPTVKHLLDLLVRGEMFAPADYLAIDVLNGESLSHSYCQNGSCAGIFMLF